jgi:hypothetical protein
VIVLMSHARDGVDDATWLGRMFMLSHAGDGAASRAGNGTASKGYIGCGKVVQPPSLEHRGVFTV